MKCIRTASFLLGLGLMLSLGGLTAQENDPKDAKVKAKEEEKPVFKNKGQLPTYWGQLGLTDVQKKEVYKIQGKHNEEIDKLEAKIKELKGKIAEERVKVLTAEQKKRLEEIIKAKAGTDK